MTTVITTEEAMDSRPMISTCTSASASSSSSLSSSPLSYTISPPSTVSSSPILFYPHHSSASPTISSSDSVDTIKSSTSTIKVTQTPPPPSQQQPLQEPLQGPAQGYNVPISITAPAPTKPPAVKKFNIPNYYVPPKGYVNTRTSSPSTSSESSQLSLTSNMPQPQPPAAAAAPPKLLRKKSGELVKSSLKLPLLLQRSLSSPNVVNSRIDDGIDSPRKSVRFATRLINVKMFNGLESPATVSSRTSPCESPLPEEYNNFGSATARNSRKLHDVEEYLDSVVETNSRRGYFDWNWSSSEEEEEGEDDDEQKNKATEYRLLKHNIPKPFETRTSPQVWLQSAYLLKLQSKTFLCGFIQVQNLAFEKVLMLKMSLDNWQNSFNFGGKSIISYVKSFTNTPDIGIDEFKFMINLKDIQDMAVLTSDKRRLNDKKMNISMCLKYEVGGNTYWANNSNRNYNFEIVQAPKIVSIAPPVVARSDIRRSKSAGPPTTELPFAEVCSKLEQLNSNHSLSTFSNMNRFSISNNFSDSGRARPGLQKAYSSSDITSSTTTTTSSGHRYSNRQRSKIEQTPALASTGSFAGLSYADLINNFCFANTTATTTSTPVANTSDSSSLKRCSSISSTGSCSPVHNNSTASTLHLLSDNHHSSIHT
ncbi:uncharacterized protein LODBEIA_P58290 [Lodderomyces beijingensis]|uniref:CBM21 domain-containing protein n=1 Tax=Lodderomyces beijingensis TaxID=1775926 RepID=A0ABP0ZTZ3_9ASCO